MRGRAAALLCAVMAVGQAAWAQDRHAASGLVLEADPARGRFVVSIEAIPGVMAAMVMPFEVRDARELTGVVPGMVVDFTLVVTRERSHAEGVKVRPFETVEQDPLAARRLALLRKIVGRPPAPLAVGDVVPDFRLVDQENRPVALSELRGQVVGINFTYTTCQLPDFCLRIVNHFAVLRKRFGDRLGRDLQFLTITFDPARDRPDVLARYASQWNPDPASWRFLTGETAEVQRVLDMFGVAAFPNEGLMDHALHTVIVDRRGRVVANVEGNRFSSDQLGDLIQAQLDSAGGAR